MKIVLMVLSTAFYSVLSGRQEDPLTEKYLRSMDIIAVMRIEKLHETKTGSIRVRTLRVFKGDVQHDMAIPVNGLRHKLKPQADYLVFLKKDKEDKISLDKCTRVISLNDAGKDIEFLESHLPCVDQEIQKKHQNAVCLMIYDPVCGCDLKTYGNMCEAKRKGITKFYFGECK